MVQLRRKKKSKDEVDIERRLRIRKARDSMEKFSTKCEKLRDNYMKQAVEAKKIGNDALVKRFAARLVNLDTQQRRAKSFVLMMNDMELNLEQLDNMGDVTATMKDFVSIFEESKIDYDAISRLKIDMDKANANSEKLSEVLDNVLSDVGDSMTSYANIDNKALESMVSEIGDRAASQERTSIRDPPGVEKENERTDDLDRRIRESLEEIDRESGKK